MEWLNPLAGGLLLAAVPIVWLYFLKTRLRETTVASGLFWDEVFEERRLRSWGRNFRHPLALLLALLTLLLLVVSEMNPVFVSQKTPEKTVVVIDNSPSMRATDRHGESRFKEAKSKLLRILSTQESNRQTAVIATGGNGKIVSGLVDHYGTLRQTVESLTIDEAPSDWNAILDLAESLMGSESSNSRLIVLTDGCPSPPERLMKMKNAVMAPVGKPVDNVAITRFQSRRSLVEAIGYETWAEVANFGEHPVECRLELKLDGEYVDMVPLSLPPGKTETMTIRGETEQGGVLTGTLDVNDALPEDNTASTTLSQKPKQKILFYGEDEYFLVHALESQENVELKRIVTVPESVPENTLLVVHRTVPPTLPHGNILIVDPGNSCDCFETGAPLESPLAVTVDRNSSMLRHVRLDGVTIPGARKLILSGENRFTSRPLLATPEGEPLFVQIDGNTAGKFGKTNILLLTTDLKQGDIPLRTAFPILLSNVMSHYRDKNGEFARTPTSTNSEESNLRANSMTNEFLFHGQGGAFPISMPPRFWLVLAALILFALDWHLFHRRWID